MGTVQFNLETILRRNKKTASALIEATGLAKTTVYNIVNNKAKAVELETLEKLLVGLRKLTGQPLSMNDLFEVQPASREERLARLLKGVKPFNWEETQKHLPELTPEDQTEGDAFIKALEDLREEDRKLSLKRDQELLELFNNDETEDAVTQ
jgi:DNA-binding Xre family transcriptional regulator